MTQAIHYLVFIPFCLAIVFGPSVVIMWAGGLFEMPDKEFYKRYSLLFFVLAIFYALAFFLVYLANT